MKYIPDRPTPPVQTDDMSDAEYLRLMIAYGEDDDRWMQEYGDEYDEDCEGCNS